MPEAAPDSLLSILQFTISPAVLVTAVSLLLGPSITRLGRAIDRARALSRELEAGAGERGAKLEQLRLVHQRAHWLRWSITCYGASVFLSCLMVFLMFVKVLAGWKVSTAVLVLLGLDIFALMAGAAFFLLDLSLGLRALDIEVAPHLKSR
ncbi:MAG: DUF2721 domain-containing protein [Elusimicrobiota bacterium]|nr:DUF2721 domain-containing protein [Elusimicrobiota bacterium]